MSGKFRLSSDGSAQGTHVWWLPDGRWESAGAILLQGVTVVRFEVSATGGTRLIIEGQLEEALVESISASDAVVIPLPSPADTEPPPPDSDFGLPDPAMTVHPADCPCSDCELPF